MSVNPTLSPEFFLFSNAHCWTAPSIWRRLLIQAFIWDWVRARTKLGMAIAARRPIMATTIIISTNVKPDLLDLLIFILTNFAFLFPRRELSNKRVYLITVLFTNCPLQP